MHIHKRDIWNDEVHWKLIIVYIFTIYKYCTHKMFTPCVKTSLKIYPSSVVVTVHGFDGDVNSNHFLWVFRRSDDPTTLGA